MLHARPTMVTKLLAFSHSFTSPFISPPPLFPKALSLSLLPAATLSPSFSYGPSLFKGHKPSHRKEQAGGETEDDYAIDKELYTRVYDIAALRVPAGHCFALESRLRGHLLNWPRIRNIARVPNDEVEDEFKNFLVNQDGDSENLVSLDRRIHGKGEGDGDVLSSVLYRDKLSRTFNSRGYVRFRNLAKMSRPRKKKMMTEREGTREKKGVGKSDVCVVEVVEEEDGMSGLLGEDFIRARSKWRGSTRLLLLDERCAGKTMEELPEAIKVSVVPTFSSL